MWAPVRDSRRQPAWVWLVLLNWWVRFGLCGNNARNVLLLLLTHVFRTGIPGGREGGTERWWGGYNENMVMFYFCNDTTRNVCTILVLRCIPPLRSSCVVLLLYMPPPPLHCLFATHSTHPRPPPPCPARSPCVVFSGLLCLLEFSVPYNTCFTESDGPEARYPREAHR